MIPSIGLEPTFSVRFRIHIAVSCNDVLGKFLSHRSCDTWPILSLYSWDPSIGCYESDHCALLVQWLAASYAIRRDSMIRLIGGCGFKPL